MRNSLLLLLAFQCLHASAQDTTGMAVDPSVKNVAALFTMTDEGGRIKNLELMESVFKDGKLGFACERHHNVSSPYIYERIQSLAKGLDPEATLLLYFNSHGGGSGDRFIMTANGGNFKFKKALESLGRSGKMIKRLIILVDTCHAEGSIQDSVGQDGELLRKIKTAVPSDSLPALPDRYSPSMMPFISVFVEKKQTDGPGNVRRIVQEVDYGLDSGVYEQILIISSSSVEDLSVRGVFASRFASTFSQMKKDESVTVLEFLKKFAESHGKTGQQPHYKLLPDDSMLSELLFGPWPAQTMPVRDARTGEQSRQPSLIPVPIK